MGEFPRSSAAKLILDNLHCSFQDQDARPLPVLAGVDLSAGENEFVAILGPSGCGKSTLFSVVSGLLPPGAGKVYLDGVEITGSPGHVAYMMQKDLLLSWRVILDNVTLGLELAGKPRSSYRQRAFDLMRTFGLEGFEYVYPSALSGGMRQRAALMRTILCDKSVLLLDEPFGALDALTRAAMHEWLLDVWHNFRRTVLFITHDPEEAVFLSDRIYVLTRRPARVKGIVEVALPRPRGHEITGTSEFARLKRQVLNLVWEEGDALRGSSGGPAVGYG